MKKTLLLSWLLLCLSGFAQDGRQLTDSIPARDGQMIESEEGSKQKKELERSEEDADFGAPVNDVLDSPSAEIMQAEALDRYRAASYPSAAGADLLTAYELAENKVDLLDEMMAYYEIIGDDASILETAVKIRTTAKYHPSIMRYQDHLLEAIPDGSILITNGEWDSYPLLCRSLAADRDILMVNLQLLRDPMYRGERLADKGLTIPENSNGADFIRQLAVLNPDRRLYVGLTVPKDILRELRPELYLNGLSFSYGTATPMEALTEQWQGAISDDLSAETALPISVARLRMNYLPMLSTILREKKTQGHTEEAERLKSQIDRICTQAGRPELKTRFK